HVTMKKLTLCNRHLRLPVIFSSRFFSMRNLIYVALVLSITLISCEAEDTTTSNTIKSSETSTQLYTFKSSGTHKDIQTATEYAKKYGLGTVIFKPCILYGTEWVCIVVNSSTGTLTKVSFYASEEG